nr:hypothetical protein CFP56_14104 [Quercus suber]
MNQYEERQQYGAFSEELSAFKVLLDGLGVELGRELAVVVDVGLLGLNFQIIDVCPLVHLHQTLFIIQFNLSLSTSLVKCVEE